MLEKEFKYYLDHQGELVQKYDGRVLVIKDEKVVGDYVDLREAYLDASQRFELGTFLIQRCSPGNQDYTQTFHSRVAFIAPTH